MAHRLITKKIKKDLEQGLSPVPARRLPVRITPEKIEEVIEFYQTGMSLAMIADIEGMPSYGGLLHAIAINPEYKSELEAARKIRALHFEELAIHELERVEQNEARDRAAVAKLKFDGYLRIAEIAAPDKYGKRTTIAGDASNPITIVVKTGVPDPLPHQIPPSLGEDGVVIVSSEVISGEEPG